MNLKKRGPLSLQHQQVTYDSKDCAIDVRSIMFPPFFKKFIVPAGTKLLFQDSKIPTNYSFILNYKWMQCAGALLIFINKKDREQIRFLFVYQIFFPPFSYFSSGELLIQKPCCSYDTKS